MLACLIARDVVPKQSRIITSLIVPYKKKVRLSPVGRRKRYTRIERGGREGKSNMPIDINEDNLKHGLLGLVIAIVEIIRDALKHQALRRMEGGSLNDEEIERLGRALEEIDIALDQLKEEQGIAGTVKNVRDGLDNLVDDVLDQMVNPER